MAKALHQRQVDVISVAMSIGVKGKVPLNKWLKTNYGKVIYLSTLNHRIAFLYVVTSIVKGLKSDVIHLTSFFAPTSLFIGIPLLIYGKKVVWSVRGEFEKSALQYHQKNKLLLLRMIKKLNPRNLHFHSTSSSESNNIRLHFGTQINITEISNFIELPPLEEHQEPIEPYFLFVGRLHPIKALDNLINALAQSDSFHISSYSLKIVGNQNTTHGQELIELVDKLNLSHKIRFLGTITGSEKNKLYRNAKFTFLISHSENFGNVVLESLAQGTPAVTSVHTPWQILKEENAGIWTDNTVQSLGEAIEQIIQMSPSRYKAVRGNALNLVQAKFDVKKNINSWVQFYKSLINA